MRGSISRKRAHGTAFSRSTTINYGMRIEQTDITLFADSPPVYRNFVDEFGSVSNSFIVSAGWSRDTRDDILFPTRGRLQSFLVESGLPLGDLAY